MSKDQKKQSLSENEREPPPPPGNLINLVAEIIARVQREGKDKAA